MKQSINHESTDFHPFDMQSCSCSWRCTSRSLSARIPFLA